MLPARIITAVLLPPGRTGYGRARDTGSHMERRGNKIDRCRADAEFKRWFL